MSPAPSSPSVERTAAPGVARTCARCGARTPGTHGRLCDRCNTPKRKRKRPNRNAIRRARTMIRTEVAA